MMLLGRLIQEPHQEKGHIYSWPTAQHYHTINNQFQRQQASGWRILHEVKTLLADRHT